MGTQRSASPRGDTALSLVFCVNLGRENKHFWGWIVGGTPRLSPVGWGTILSPVAAPRPPPVTPCRSCGAGAERSQATFQRRVFAHTKVFFSGKQRLGAASISPSPLVKPRTAGTATARRLAHVWGQTAQGLTRKSHRLGWFLGQQSASSCCRWPFAPPRANPSSASAPAAPTVALEHRVTHRGPWAPPAARVLRVGGTQHCNHATSRTRDGILG